MDNGQRTTDNGGRTTDNGQQTTDNGKRTMERKIENLKIWNDSRVFVNDIYKMMASCRDYGFRDQIMNNIAEGFESGSDASFVRYLQIAKGSCSEVKSMLFLCEDFQICTSERRNELQTQLFNLSSGIYKLIQFLIKKQ